MFYSELPPPPPAVVKPAPTKSAARPLSTPAPEQASEPSFSDPSVSKEWLNDLLAQRSDVDLPTLPASVDDPFDDDGLNDTDRPAVEDTEPPVEEADEPVNGPVQIEVEGDRPPQESPEDPETFASTLRLNADSQEYDPDTQIITARGNVLLQLNDAVIEADELWVNLVNRYALAEGDVLLTRGAQLVRGSRLEYNFIQQAGVVGQAVGTIFLPSLDEDLASPLSGPTSSRPAYNPIDRRPDLRVRGDGSLQFGSSLSTQLDDSDDDASSPIRQLRFETDELAFGVEGWRADDVRITNDPFSPPELELRTDSLILRNISPTQDELLLKRPRLVFDQGFALPLFRNRIVLNRGEVNSDDVSPVLPPVGIDGRDRGGIFLGRPLPVITTDKLRLTFSPQYFVQRAFSDESDSPIDPGNFGGEGTLRATLTPRTTVIGNLDITGLEPSELTENIRASLRLQQRIGDHRLSLQSSYRERLFNGSLGFRNVQASLGAVLLSPTYRLGKTGIRLTYQGSAQWINAESDREDLLLSQGSESERISLGRYQGSVALRRNFDLWRGQPKLNNQYEGLRYTPEPVVPYLRLRTGLRLTSTYYTSGDTQNNLLARVGLEAQLGHFSRNFGDYTRLNVGYTQSFIGEADSPFLFDRAVDRNVLSLGITQQIYGPFLAGYRTALSFDGGGPINSIYTLEYSRRTYGILLRYDTVQNTGAVGFRLSNFDWIGDTNPFDTPRVRNVQGGVIEAPP